MSFSVNLPNIGDIVRPNASTVSEDTVDEDVLELLSDDDEYEDENSEGTETRTTAAPINWDDDTNPYKPRVAGLQGSLQKAVEERNRIAAEKEQANRQLVELQNAVFAQQIAHLSPEEQWMARQEFENARQSVAKDEELRVREQELNYKASEMTQTLKSQAINVIIGQTGVPAQLIEHLNDPYVMLNVAEQWSNSLSSSQRKQVKTARKTSGADTFEGGTSSSPPKKKKYSDLEDASADFGSYALRNYKKR